MGYVAAPFDGNVPLFDLLVADQRGFTIPIQVKTVNGPSWQYRADSFLEIEIVNDFQHIHGKKPLLNPDLVCIYILLRDNSGHQRRNSLKSFLVAMYPTGSQHSGTRASSESSEKSPIRRI